MNFDFNCDFVICIDATGDMHNLTDDIKRAVTGFYDGVKAYLKGAAFNTDNLRLRLKVIAFGDYACDCEPMKVSGFFNLPEDNEKLATFVDGIKAEGGGDLPENALEALTFAIRSEWAKGAKRKAVALITNAPAHKLKEREGVAGYPENMPSDTDELFGEWNALNNGRRLIIFAPEVEPWCGEFAEKSNLREDGVTFVPLNEEDFSADFLTEELLAATFGDY